MAFQLPATTTTAGATGLTFGLNTTPVAPTTIAAAAAKPTFSFGASVAAAPVSTGSGGGGGDADTSKAAAPPTFGFGLPAASTTPLTGVVAPAAAPQTTAVAAPSTLFGNFTAQQPAPAGPNLGAPALGLTTRAKSTTAPPPTATAVAPLTSTAAPGTGGTASGDSAFANLTTATKTTDSAAVASASQLTYNQLEEHINKWTLEFEEQEKVFTEQATQINAWDKILTNNNQKILELNDAVQKVKNDQQVLDQELEFIATQHKELEESLAPLEKEFLDLPRVDLERSQTYLMVENLDTQLKQMSEDLKEIIDNLNEANKGQDNTDPIIQIGKILNAHMSSLQWIESQSANICKKLDDIGKLHETQKRDLFRPAY